VLLALAVLLEIVIILAYTAVWFRWVSKGSRADPPTAWTVSGLVAAGAVGFIASQVVHIPLNLVIDWFVKRPFMPRPAPSHRIYVTATILGLTAGLCEETARYLVLRFWQKSARGYRAAIAYGVGHGGCEAILVGLGSGASLLAMALARWLGPGLMRVPARQVQLYWATAAYEPLLAGLERVFAVTFHLSASLLVMQALVRRSRWPLVLAIAWHAFTDGGAIVVVRHHGIIAAEEFAAATTVVSALIILACRRDFQRAAPR
jgi:uncharacterized membrane protein YhfC